MFVSLLCHKVLPARIESKDTIKLVGRDVLQSAKVLNARVRNDNINFPEVLLRFLKQGDNIRYMANVGLDSNGLATHAGNLFGDLRRCLCALYIVYDDISTK